MSVTETETAGKPAEWAAPPGPPGPGDRNLTDALYRHEAWDPDLPLLAVADTAAGGGWRDLTAGEVARSVRDLATGLVAAGIRPGDRVGLLSRTRVEWTLCDYAIWSAGAVTVPIYETSSAEQIEWILSDSGARAVFCERSSHLAVVTGLRSRLPELTHTWCFDAGGLDALASGATDESRAEVERRRAAVTGDDIASIVYTSGTTGRPKGCVISHDNCLAELYAATPQLAALFGRHGSTLLFLPLAHIFGRAVQIASIATGTRLAYCPDPTDLVADLRSFRPTFVLAVPRIFEKVYDSARAQAHRAQPGPLGRVIGPAGAALFDDAEAVAVAWSQASQAGRVPVALAARHALYDRLVYARLRAALGGRVRWAVSGGGPLGSRLGHFFRGAGVTVLEAYGLTETVGGATVNTPSAFRVGTVGRPVPGTSLRIADDGEVLVRGANVFRGYWHDEASSAASFEDGWLRTGDIGEVDSDGYLSITGRKKELIVTAAGKNVAPAILEDRLRAARLVSQCMVVGDRRPFVAALVTVDEEAWADWAAAHGIDGRVADHVDDDRLRMEIQEAVDSANAAVSRAESIREFTILGQDFSEQSGELTPTLKLKRSVVAANRAEEIEALYSRRR